MTLKIVDYSPLKGTINIIGTSVLTSIPGILAIIFGIVGIVRDDSKGWGITGLILGALNFIFLLIRFYIHIRSYLLPISLLLLY